MVNIVKLGVLALLILVGAALAYVRLAPTDASRWHRMPDEISDRDLAGGAMRRAEGELAALHAIIRDTPRTRVLAGSVASGMVTYVTRSRVFGFPDYTTVRQAGETLEVYGRLRFGRSDMGVNAERIDGWLARLRQAR